MRSDATRNNFIELLCNNCAVREILLALLFSANYANTCTAPNAVRCKCLRQSLLNSRPFALFADKKFDCGAKRAALWIACANISRLD